MTANSAAPPTPSACLRAGRVLAASLLLSAALGSIHAFSVFIAPLEQRFAAPRADVSAAYSLALLAVTLGVALGDRVYRRFPPARLVLALGTAAGAGLALAAFATTLWQLWLGYSLVFGLANGLGYGFALHAAGQSHPRATGRAMGLVTAAYALGAAATPFALEPWLAAGDLQSALLLLAAAMPALALPGAACLARAGFVFRWAPAAGAARPRAATVALLWAVYGAAVAAGLMAIGHASEIARGRGAADSWVLAAPALLAIANVGGSVLGGVLVDRRGVLAALAVLPVGTAAALLLLALLPGATAALAGLALTGFAYGATIAAYPAAIVRRFGAAPAVRIYGAVFTAWGAAGFLAPWFAGRLFDATGNYRTPLLAAAGLALASAVAVCAGRRSLAPR